jgi:hypothetical protein
MLQFKGTSHTSRSSSATTSEVPQLIDVRQYANVISSGNAVFSAFAYFNRAAGDEQTDTIMGIHIYALDGNPSSYSSDRESGIWLSDNAATITADADPATWELCQLQVVLPINTDYIAFQVTAWETIYNDVSSAEFDGHFVDAVSVQIVPEPCTLLLLGVGGVMISKKVKGKREN